MAPKRREVRRPRQKEARGNYQRPRREESVWLVRECCFSECNFFQCMQVAAISAMVFPPGNLRLKITMQLSSLNPKPARQSPLRAILARVAL